MSFKRMWALFVARNFEFIRDRAGFGWNILFPFLIVAGFGVIFSSDSRSEFKLGVFPVKQDSMTVNELKIPEKLKTYDHIKIVPFETHDEAMDKLLHHKIDILLENKGPKLRYWINNSSPKGYVLEKVVKESIIPEEMFASRVIKQQIKGAQVRYIDWLFPGILGMNIMFSSLFGVGYVIVRYRRSGVLKRLKATPVTAFEYLTAQLVSRVLILLATSSLVWFGCDLFFSFQMQGSYFDAFVIFLAGSICLVSLGLIIACRGTNEELTNGAINFICWPMMFLSEVWFSIEGASAWVKSIANALPLTHFLSAVRKIINDGATLSEVSSEITILLVMSLAFLCIGSLLFSWTK
ncbi:ABC transporter permease [Desulfobacula sp.]|uniref:ABC transporter permease n=1 Tax=Desulfobacula sp. TaxID=2593537 RepID=UPI0025B8518B|nr:ABC transporter permease [Desulfobacula sp.]MBC2704546.1 ABC transporter permease [Desulfobacula sp.]